MPCLEYFCQADNIYSNNLLIPMRLFIALLLLIASGKAFAQKNNFSDTVYYMNTWEKVNKKYATYYRIPVEKDGEKTYKVTYYRMDGTLYMIGHYIPKLIDYHYSIEKDVATQEGYFCYYSNSGRPTAEGELHNDKKINEWKYYDKNSGKLSTTEFFYEGQDIIYATTYNTDGKKIREGILVTVTEKFVPSSRRHDTWSFYYNNGALWKTLNYKFGKLEGRATYYDSASGKVRTTGKFVNGERDSVWTYYYLNNYSVRKIEAYKDGFLEGAYKEFNEGSDKVFVEGNYHNGKLTGNWKCYYPQTDKLLIEAYYKNGSANAVIYDSSSKMKIMEGPYKNWKKTGEWKMYFPRSTKVFLTEEYANDLLNGRFIQYDTAGNIVLACMYTQGRKNGEMIGYYEGTDKIWTVLNFVNDTLHGQLTSYYRSGNVKRKESYDMNHILENKCFSDNGAEIDCSPFVTMAAFDGDVMTYIGDNLQYPEVARDAGIEGKVEVGFWINESGLVNNVQVLKGIDKACDEEAVRLVSHMPPWHPMMVDDRPVMSYKTLPIVFWIH